MSGKTPGRAAYEAYEAQYEQLTGDPAASWEVERDDNRAAWEAAAQAAIATALAELPDSRDETDRLRVLVAEILGHLDTAGIVIDGELRTAWRERAELPAIKLQPSPKLTETQIAELRERFATAGTEHLIDPGDPRSWQKVADMPARER